MTKATVETPQSTTTSSLAANFLSAVKSRFGLGSLGSSLFSDILDQATTLAASSATTDQASATASDQMASLASAATSPDDKSDDDLTALLAAASDKDAARLQELLAELKKDAADLRALRGKKAAKDQTDDSATPTQAQTETVPLAAANDETTTTEVAAVSTDETLATALATTDDATTQMDDATSQAALLAAMAVPVVQKAEPTVATSGELDVTAGASAGASDADEAALLQAMAAAQAELKALLAKATHTGKTTGKSDGTAAALSAVAGDGALANDNAPLLATGQTAAGLEETLSSQTDTASPKTKALPFAADFAQAQSASPTQSGTAQAQDTDEQTTTKAAGASASSSSSSASAGAVDMSSLMKTPAANLMGTASAALREQAAQTTGAAAHAGIEGVTASGSASAAAGRTDLAGALTAGGGKTASSYDFASQLSSASGSKTTSSAQTSPVEQVAMQLHKQVKAGDDEITVLLRPADLGKIEIKLTISSDNKVQGTVVADNPTTLTLLSQDSSSLQRALQEAGLQADASSLQFSLRDGSQQGAGGQNNQGNFGGTNQTTLFIAREDDAPASSVYAPSLSDTTYLTPGRVNLSV